MEILKAIDLFLQNVFVRWALLIITVAALGAATWAKLHLKTVQLQRDAAEGKAATCNATLDMQNTAISKAADATRAKQNQLNEAAKHADDIKKDRDAWRKKALSTPLTGSCDEMVEQVIESLK